MKRSTKFWVFVGILFVIFLNYCWYKNTDSIFIILFVMPVDIIVLFFIVLIGLPIFNDWLDRL